MARKQSEKILKGVDCMRFELPTTRKRPGEIWKQVPGYRAFQASNLGRIRSVRVRLISPCRTHATVKDDLLYHVVA